MFNYRLEKLLEKKIKQTKTNNYHSTPILFEEKYLLEEAYRKTDKNVCRDFVELLHDFLISKISSNEFKAFESLHDFELQRVEGSNVIGGFYDYNTRKITLLISDDVLAQIQKADDKQLDIITDNIWTNFVHEDTHKQQFQKYDNSKNYASPKSLDWSDNLEKSLDYFEQVMEADAYGREIGARLKTIYEFSTDSGHLLKKIFQDINNNDVTDEYSSKIINIYKHPKNKATKKFFRALYDFLNDQELK